MSELQSSNMGFCTATLRLPVPYMDSLGTINRSLHTGIDASLYSGFVEELPLPHRCVRTIMPILRSGFFNAEVPAGS